MNRTRHIACLLALWVSASIVALAQQVVPIDTKASLLKWTGHAEVGSYSPTGTLLLREGEIRFDKSSFRSAHLVVDMDSLKQDNSDLQHHLKSADFFDVEHFPTALIDLNRFTGDKVSGSLTIHGKAAPFESPVSVTAAGDHFVVTGKASLDRTKYGIVYNSTSFFSGLGNKAISNQFDVEFTVVGRGPLPAGSK